VSSYRDPNGWKNKSTHHHILLSEQANSFLYKASEVFRFYLQEFKQKKMSTNPNYHPQPFTEKSQYSQLPTSGGNTPVGNTIQMTSYPPSAPGQVVQYQPGMIVYPQPAYPSGGTYMAVPAAPQGYGQAPAYPSGGTYTAVPAQPQGYGQAPHQPAYPSGGTYPAVQSPYPVAAGNQPVYTATVGGAVQPARSMNNSWMMVSVIAGGICCCCVLCIVIPIVVLAAAGLLSGSGWYNKVYYLDSACISPVVQIAYTMDECIFYYNSPSYETVRFTESGSSVVESFYADNGCANSARTYTTPSTTSCLYDPNTGLYSTEYKSSRSFGSVFASGVPYLSNDGHSKEPVSKSRYSDDTGDGSDPGKR
jgi:hypothetical protein